MSRFEALFLHLSNALVGGTGLVYAWMVYLVEPADPFAVANHPWQPHLQHLHVLAAPLLVFASGLIWRRHVVACWKQGIRQRHRSGVSLALTLVPMVVSGYLIQTAAAPGWRQVWVWVHLVSSGLWLLGYLVHQAVSLRRAGKGRHWHRRSADSARLSRGAGELGPAIEDPQRHPRAVSQ